MPWSFNHCFVCRSDAGESGNSFDWIKLKNLLTAEFLACRVLGVIRTRDAPADVTVMIVVSFCVFLLSLCR